MNLLMQSSLNVSLIGVLCFTSITDARPHDDTLPPTRERLADMVADHLNLDLQHFETSFEIEHFNSLPAKEQTHWDKAESLMRISVKLLISDGMMRAVVSDRDKPDEQLLAVWDGGKTILRITRKGNTNFIIQPSFQITGTLDPKVILRFNLIDDLFPTQTPNLADAIRQHPVLSQQVKDGVLTHRWIAGKSATFCQIKTLIVRLAPEFKILSHEMLMADTPDVEEAEHHLVMRRTMKFEDWERHGTRLIPKLLYLDTFMVKDREDRENTMIKQRVVCRRTDFKDLSRNPPAQDQFTLPLVYGARVSDVYFNPEWYLSFTVGSRSLQVQSLMFRFDDPILNHPGYAITNVLKRAYVQLDPQAEPFGVNPPLQLFNSGGPGDPIRERLRELPQERFTFEGNKQDPEALAENAQRLNNWHIQRIELIKQLWDIEPDALELPSLLQYRWKYVDLLPDIDLMQEVRTFAKTHPGEGQAIIAGKYWLSAHRATSLQAAPHQREAAADAFIRSHPDDLRSARLLTLCWLATDDPVTADRLRSRIVASYPNSSEGLTFFGQIREVEAVGETVDFTFTDRRNGREISMKDLRGKVVVLNFWSTWCGPCIGSMPQYKKDYRELKEKYAERFEMIGINMDSDPQTMLAFCEEHKIEWPQLCEEGKSWDTSVAQTFGVRGIPRVIIVGSDGRVRNMRARATNFLVNEVTTVFLQEKRERLKEKGDDKESSGRGEN